MYDIHLISSAIGRHGGAHGGGKPALEARGKTLNARRGAEKESGPARGARREALGERGAAPYRRRRFEDDVDVSSLGRLGG